MVNENIEKILVNCGRLGNNVTLTFKEDVFESADCESFIEGRKECPIANGEIPSINYCEFGIYNIQRLMETRDFIQVLEY